MNRAFFSLRPFYLKKAKKEAPPGSTERGLTYLNRYIYTSEKNLKKSEAENTPIKIFKDDYRTIVHCKNYNKRKRERIQCYKFIRQ